MTSWKEKIESSELIFLQTSKRNQRIFDDYEGAAFRRGKFSGGAQMVQILNTCHR
jgi:hypothetical protein